MHLPGNRLPEQQCQTSTVKGRVAQRQQVRMCLFPDELSLEPRQEPLRMA
ncbi:hypothetical protein [Acidovorax sp. 69]|nr:hypothetical protein [Acidovorax sp. 69]